MPFMIDIYIHGIFLITRHDAYNTRTPGVAPVYSNTGSDLSNRYIQHVNACFCRLLCPVFYSLSRLMSFYRVTRS